MSLEAKAELTKTGRLRFGINLSNMLLVSDRKDDGTPVGVSPDMARAVAEKLRVLHRCRNFVVLCGLRRGLERCNNNRIVGEVDHVCCKVQCCRCALGDSCKSAKHARNGHGNPPAQRVAEAT